jgi:predicted DNA-binding transcriptional regulator AlpA
MPRIKPKNDDPLRKADLLDLKEVCELFGGVRSPINRSTLYRGIRAGRFPKPVKIGLKTSRWRRDQCEAALKRMMESV